VTTDAQLNSNTMPRCDDALVGRAKTDRAAFGLLFDRYYGRIAQYCLRRLPNREIAEDVTSDVFLQMAAHLGTFAGQTEIDFRCWLFRIATNAIAAHQRQARRRTRLWQTAARRGDFDRPQTAHPADAELDRLDWPAVREAIGQLDERQQTIVTLRFFADCSHEEIAGVVECSVGAVRTALARALARLRGKLDSLGPAR
jgi:RNA polymerase sigma-70 factor (ECF subfamily)